MNANTLNKLSYRLLKLRKRLEEGKKGDAGLQPLFELADKLWSETYRLAERREIEEARRKDGGEIVWELFFPRDYGWERQKVLTRTPNLLIETSSFSGNAFTRRRQPAAAFLELAEAWKPADPGRMRARAALVDSKPREFWDQREAA